MFLPSSVDLKNSLKICFESCDSNFFDTNKLAPVVESCNQHEFHKIKSLTRASKTHFIAKTTNSLIGAFSSWPPACSRVHLLRDFKLWRT